MNLKILYCIKSIILWSFFRENCLCRIIWLPNPVFAQVMIFKNMLPSGGGNPNLLFLAMRGQHWVPSMSDLCPEPSSLGCSEILKKPLAFCRITPLVWLTIKIGFTHYFNLYITGCQVVSSFPGYISWMKFSTCFRFSPLSAIVTMDIHTNAFI